MMNLPSVRHLRYLTALHDHGHFGRAANACHVTQSTLSARLKNSKRCSNLLRAVPNFAAGIFSLEWPMPLP